MSTPRTGREIHLASRPTGWPVPENFSIVEATVPDPAAGQVLIRNQFMSVDPYMRGRMNDVKSYVPPFQVGAALDGGAVGVVVASNAAEIAVGDTVLHGKGWRDYAVAGADQVQRVDPALAPASAYLGVLGMPGLTAYAGLLEVAALAEGDTVFVSGAAGAVGSLAGQIARLRGAARVVGSAGSADKVRYLVDELGFDAAFNYKEGPVADQLAKAAPGGIDVYFDNVGGDHLEAAIGALNPFGRVAACGAIAQYNDTEPAPGPRNLGLIIGKQLTVRGFIVGSYGHLREQFAREVGGWLREDRIKFRETVVDGLDQAPAAFLGLLRGDNVGKMLVRVADPAAA